jgi:AhpD family alkylhydroperoxidase
MIPNGVEVHATSAPAVNAWSSFETAIGASTLPRMVPEQLAVMTAAHNGCTYCLSAHIAAARRLGLSADQTNAAQRAQATNPLAAAVLAFGAAAPFRSSVAGGFSAQDQIQGAQTSCVSVPAWA